MDENGYLIDDKGNFVLDDYGQKIKLDENDIEIVRENGLYEEIESSFYNQI